MEQEYASKSPEGAISTIPKVDYVPLVEPVSALDVATYRQKYGSPGQSMQLIGYWTLSSFILIVVAFMIVGALSTQAAPGTAHLTQLIVSVVIVIASVLLWFKYVHTILIRNTKISKFAGRNGFDYSPHMTPLTSYNGMIFDDGDGRKFYDVLEFNRGNQKVEIGNYEYTTGSGKSRTTHHYGYMRLRLPRRVPHMVLDSKANNTQIFGVTMTTGLSDSFDTKQTLSLEGDFDTHFTLYCPKEYERDALYIFTPDLMALMIDESAAYDVEIVDDSLYVYQNGSMRQYDPESLRRLIRIAEVIGAKMHTRTDYYADERVGDRSVNVVAGQGRRLKKGISWVVVAGVVIYILLYVIDFVSKL